jgi:type IV pilus assembly protein PilY1
MIKSISKSFPFLLFLLLILCVSPSIAAMEEYCVSPPFLTQSISPNILIVLDNSGSMCGEAYSGSYNPSQFDNGLYYGYFEGAKNYKYNGSRWEVTTEAMTNGTTSNPIANGSFLNWAAMRRTEISKKLLIGGKANPRSPEAGQTVKLDGETGCDRDFDKDFDTSAGNLIFPFVGNYNFRNEGGDLEISALSGGSIFTVRPNADLTTPMPTGWTEHPAFGTPIAYTKVDEVSSDGDSTYIQNSNTASPIVMDFSYADSEPAGMITVKVYVRAKRINTSRTRRIRAILRIDNTDYESSRTSLNNSYDTYSWTWTLNPETNAAWTWDQIKQIATSDNLDGFGLRAESNYSGSPSIRVTQVYLTAEVTLPDGGPYNLIVDQGMQKAEGLIDNLDDEVRFGLTYFNNDRAGRVDTYVGYASPTNMITSIHNMVPSTWTPLGETLREMIGYYRQDSPYYVNNPADYSVGTGNMGSPNIFRDPYAYKFTDIDNTLTDMYVPCAKSFVLFLTDGESTMDQSMPGSSTSSPYAECTSTNLKACSGYGGPPNNPDPRFAGTSIGRTYTSNGTDYMIDVAYWARTNDMRPGVCTTVPTTWDQCLPGDQNVFLYPIFMFGTGSSLLQDASIYGGFVDSNGNGKPDCSTIPSECYKDSDEDGTIESNGDDLPLTYYEGNDGYALEKNIKKAITDITARAASSTAVSVLSSSEGSGANLVQALFYPKRTFSTGAEISWTSDLMNYWYYLDPYFKNAQIREDTIHDELDSTLLDLKSDFITSFYFDGGQEKTLAARCQDTDGDGDCDTAVDTVRIEDAKAIWRAGVNLWWTDPAARTIKTSLDGSNLISFDTGNRDALDDYLGLTTNVTAATTTIDYVRGIDLDKICSTSKVPCTSDTDCSVSGEICTAARSRNVPMNVCSLSGNPCTTNLDCGVYGGSCVAETHTWKLGDIISSTPRILGPSPLNNYHTPPPIAYGDESYQDFITTTDYKSRERVFVGSNDGMFHSFKLGKVLQKWPNKEWWQPEKLEGSTGAGGIGTESWAFIPKNVLPYLQHLSNPDYCHIYMVDGPVTLVDASINCGDAAYWDCAKQTTTLDSSWRSIAIGSMGIGGATSNDVADSSCVKTPLEVNGSPVGWSSYFALDVTAQDNPSILWEFSNPDLGVTNVGPAIVKVGGGKRCITDNSVCSVNSDCAIGDECVGANGRWFAIFASGATGPITTKDFMGTSDQPLRLFILDLKTGTLLRTIDTTDLGITNAFAGSLSSNTVDLEKSNRYHDGHYQDDVVYIGYVKNTTGGGVLRLVINDDINPANWTYSKVIDNIGPVTTSVVNLLDPKARKLWLYFAEGRYFHKLDDPTNQRRLYGIQEPCFFDDPLTATTIDLDVRQGCNTLTTLASLKDQTTSPSALLSTQTGWYVNLDPATTMMGAERVISNPTPDTAGAVYFLSFAPNSDICGYGGTTYLWALDYKSGGQVDYTMQGKALVQVSTGEIKELDLSDSDTFSGNNGRRSAGFQGIPPTGQALVIVTNPSPIRRFMHIQEQ